MHSSISWKDVWRRERIWIVISYTVKFQRFAFWEWKILATCLRYFCCLIRFTLRFQLPFLSLCTVMRYIYEGLYNKYICSLMISSRVTLKYLCVLYLFLPARYFVQVFLLRHSGFQVPHLGSSFNLVAPQLSYHS